MTAFNQRSEASLPSNSSERVALVNTLARLWPGGEVELVRGRSRSGTSFALLPSASHPRMLAPVVPRAAAAAAMGRYSLALTKGETLARMAATPLLGMFGSGVLSQWRVQAQPGQDTLVERLSGFFNEPVTFALTIGKPRANRKPVLQVFDRKGRTLAFVKVGDSAVSSELVEAEARALEQLDGRLVGFEVPKLLALTDWAGMRLLLMSPLELRPQALVRPPDLPLAAMASFSLQLGHRTAPLREVPQWQRLRVARFTTDSGIELIDLVDRIEQLAQGAPDFVVGTWHGDWTAWNTARHGAQVQLWDFERFETGVVHGLEGFHYAVNEATSRHGATVPVILGGLERAHRAMGAGPQRGLLAAVYLVAILERYLGSAERERGYLIQARTNRMVEALGEWLSRLELGQYA